MLFYHAAVADFKRKLPASIVWGVDRCRFSNTSVKIAATNSKPSCLASRSRSVRNAIPQKLEKQLSTFAVTKSGGGSAQPADGCGRIELLQDEWRRLRVSQLSVLALARTRMKRSSE